MCVEDSSTLAHHVIRNIFLGRQVNLPTGKQLSLGYEAGCVEDSSTQPWHIT